MSEWSLEPLKLIKCSEHQREGSIKRINVLHFRKEVWTDKTSLVSSDGPPGAETGQKLTHSEKKRDHTMLETLSLFILVFLLLFVLNLTGTKAWSVQVKMIYECFVRAEAIGTDNRRHLSRKQAGIMYMTGAFQQLGNLHFFGFISLSLTVGVFHSFTPWRC